MPEIAVGIRPFVPYLDTSFLKPAGVGIAPQKPQQLVDDAFQMHLFGGDERKSVGETEPHLIAERGDCAGAGAVLLPHAGVENVPEKVEILFHVRFCLWFSHAASAEWPGGCGSAGT